MIRFPTEMLNLTPTPAAPGTPPLASSGEGSGLDFAGLLGAALPQSPVNSAAVVTLGPAPAQPADGTLPTPEVGAVAPPLAELPLTTALPATPAPPVSFLPTGRILPLPGVDLPEPLANLPASTGQPVAAAVSSDARPLVTTAEGDRLPTDAEVPSEETAPPSPAAATPRAAVRTPRMAPAATKPVEEPPAAPTAVKPAPESDAETASPDAPGSESQQPDAAPAMALAPSVLIAPQSPAPAAVAPAAAPEILATTVRRPLAMRVTEALPGQAKVAQPAADAAKSARAASDNKEEPTTPAAPSTSNANAVAAATKAGDAALLLADAATPAVAAPSAPTAIAQAHTSAPTPALERGDVRADAPAPQQQSTIDQVGTLREALRSVRPAMTLHHAEFGAVSLRLEATGAGDWRAVLASRDPGFVPAIQAALADRALAAADSANLMGQSGGFHSNSGQNGASQYGTGDHRSGATPNGGQGASQPYLGQSTSRDGEAAPDHRRPSTAAAIAARAEAEEGGSGSHGQASGGLFA